MATVYKITITKKSKESFTGLMTRSQPEIVNGYVASVHCLPMGKACAKFVTDRDA